MTFIQFSFSREPLKLLQYLRDEKVQWPYGPTYRSSCRSLQTVGWQTNEHGRGCPTVVYTVSIRVAVTGVWSEGSRFAQLWNKEVTSSTFFNIKHLLLEHVSLWLDYGWIETLPFIERLQKLHKSRALKLLPMRPFTEESWLQLGGTERKQPGRARHGRNGPGSCWSDGWESSGKWEILDRVDVIAGSWSKIIVSVIRFHTSLTTNQRSPWPILFCKPMMCNPWIVFISCHLISECDRDNHRGL